MEGDKMTTEGQLMKHQIKAYK